MNFIKTFQSKENPSIYCKYYNLSSYLKKKYLDAVTNIDNERKIAEALGYNYDDPQKRSQFRKTMNKMNNLNADIPIKYLNLINAEKSIILLCLEEDQLAYKKQLEIPRYPEIASYRYTACVYGCMKFPLGSTEEEAIRLCQDNLKDKPIPHVIIYKNFLIIYVSRDGISRYYYPPTIRFGKHTLMIEFKEKIEVYIKRGCNLLFQVD